MKKPISAKIDEVLWRHVQSKPNASRYIEALIKQDFQMQRSEPLYDALVARLLKDSEALGQLRLALTKQPDALRKVVTQREYRADDVRIDTNTDWGA